VEVDEEVEEEVLLELLLEVVVRLGARMRNHTIAKIIPRMSRIVNTIIKIARGLLVNQS
jgi:hypothetical protein